MTTKFKTISTLLLGAVLFTGCQQQQAPVAPPVAQYEMLTITKGDCTITTLSSATIRGRQDIDIYPQVGGTLTELNVKEGESVKRGDVMFVIDQIPYKAAVATAKAALATAKATLSTSKLTLESKTKLHEAGVVSEFDLLTAENSYMVAQAQVAQAEAGLVNAENNLSYTTVTSPVDGVVGVLPYRVGALVSSAMMEPLTTVSDNSVMYVYFSMAENDLLSMVRKYGSREKALKSFPAVDLILSDGSTYDEQGKISSMSGVINRTTGSITLRAEFPNSKGLLHSGATGNVAIPAQRNDVIVIPRKTTYELQDRVFVITAFEGKAKSKAVSVEAITGGKDYIVTAGLEVGDEIVAEGVGVLREGTPIMAKGAAAPAAAPTAESK